ncbi:MAG: hypothetical protein M3238_08570, partial [Actinomycetota bacterium]|nr:hypothetical protein [Actinomycetota bacterium]
MALKGKKKSRARGSQARRRPGAAPRPAAAARRRPPWYRTSGGRIAAAMLSILLIGLIVWPISNSRSEARELEERQQALNDYSDGLRGLLQVLTPPVAELSTAPQMEAGRLDKELKAWKQAFSAAQGQLEQIDAPEGLRATNRLVLQSILLYISAGDTYGLSADLAGRDRQRLQAQAAIQLTTANDVFLSGIEVLDAARAE